MIWIDVKIDCIVKFCELVREHAMKIISFKQNEAINKRGARIICKSKKNYICKEKFETKYFKDKKHRKVRDHCHYRVREYRSAVNTVQFQ